VLTTYGSLLRRPGTLRFTLAAFVMRLPLSMLGLGVVLFLTLRGESYALAGGLAASAALANALVGPFVSRVIDRRGQHRVLPVVVSVSVVMQVAFVAAVLLDLPVWTWFVTLCVGEMFVPNVGSLVRARWAYVLDEPADVRTAFAFESVVDEVIFVAGPIVATALAVSVAQWGAVGAAIVLLVVGTLLLVPQRSTEPPPAGPEHHEGKAAVRYRGVPIVTAVFVLVGGVFGAFEVTTVATAEELGVRGWTGLFLAAYALGSGIAGLGLGAMHLRTSIAKQLRWFLLVLAVVSVPFPFIQSPLVLGVVCFVAGFAVAPSLINGFALIERLVPSQRLTEGLTVAMAGLTVGFAVGTSVAGPIIDTRGPSTAYLLLVACSVGAAAVAWAGARSLDRALAAADAASEEGQTDAVKPRQPL
jgi:predicted MFS family arabinose efflux permease